MAAVYTLHHRRRRHHHHRGMLSLSLQPSEAHAHTASEAKCSRCRTEFRAIECHHIVHYVTWTIFCCHRRRRCQCNSFVSTKEKSAHTDSCAIDPNNKPKKAMLVFLCPLRSHHSSLRMAANVATHSLRRMRTAYRCCRIICHASQWYIDWPLIGETMESVVYICLCICDGGTLWSFVAWWKCACFSEQRHFHGFNITRVIAVGKTSHWMFGGE